MTSWFSCRVVVVKLGEPGETIGPRLLLPHALRPPPSSSRGCTKHSNTRAYFQTATLNDQPARLMLDTGASTTILSSSAARRIDIHFTPPPHISAAEKARHHGEAVVGLSGPASFAVGNNPITAQFPYVPGSLPDDGLVGWPEIRDNIPLIFNPAERTITAANQLPPQTATWQQ